MNLRQEKLSVPRRSLPNNWRSSLGSLRDTPRTPTNKQATRSLSETEVLRKPPVAETPFDTTLQDPLIAKGWQREQYIGITILFVALIAVIGFFSRRFEYALIFAFALSLVLIVFLLTV